MQNTDKCLEFSVEKAIEEGFEFKEDEAENGLRVMLPGYNKNQPDIVTKVTFVHINDVLAKLGGIIWLVFKIFMIIFGVMAPTWFLNSLTKTIAEK